MIFAAGLGTRMGALTLTRPKPLLAVAGRPLLDHALALGRDAGVPRVVVNTHAHAEQVRAHLARVAPDVCISHEPERLETGGGLKRALPLLGSGPVLTLNADMVWRGPNPLTLLAAAWRPGDGALLALLPRAAAVGHAGAGDFFLRPDGTLDRRGAAATADFVYAGAGVIDPAAVAAFPGEVFSLNPVWDALRAEGRLRGVVYPGGWVDVGRPEGIALAEEELAR
jgi:MurNAc alpha-1-phosphate uridylyltransferase